jgi:hypothetical protein
MFVKDTLSAMALLRYAVPKSRFTESVYGRKLSNTKHLRAYMIVFGVIHSPALRSYIAVFVRPGWIPLNDKGGVEKHSVECSNEKELSSDTQHEYNKLIYDVREA